MFGRGCVIAAMLSHAPCHCTAVSPIAGLFRSVKDKSACPSFRKSKPCVADWSWRSPAAALSAATLRRKDLRIPLPRRFLRSP